MGMSRGTLGYGDDKERLEAAKYADVVDGSHGDGV